MARAWAFLKVFFRVRDDPLGGNMKRPERPTQKVTASAAGGALGIIVAWALGQFGLDVPGEVGGAFSTVGAFTLGYFRRDA